MTIKRTVLGGLAGLLLGLCQPGAAHHGQAGLFDESRTVELSGTVREWIFVNPHPVLVISVADERGATEDWDVYFGPSAVSALRRRGFSADTFAIGETVIVKGHLATAPGARGIDVWGASSSVSRADGSPIP